MLTIIFINHLVVKILALINCTVYQYIYFKNDAKMIAKPVSYSILDC